MTAKTKRETLKISSFDFESQKNFLPLHRASTRSHRKQDEAKALKFFRLKLAK